MSGRAHIRDDELLRLIAQGDEQALGALYDRYGRLVFNIALRVTDDRLCAEEVTQDVFHRVWTHAYGFRPVAGSPAGWIIGITRHRAIDEIRSSRYKGRQREVWLDDLPQWSAPIAPMMWSRPRSAVPHSRRWRRSSGKRSILPIIAASPLQKSQRWTGSPSARSSHDCGMGLQPSVVCFGKTRGKRNLKPSHGEAPHIISGPLADATDVYALVVRSRSAPYRWVYQM